MTEQRAFTVVVTGCKDCPNTAYAKCYHPDVTDYFEQEENFIANHSQLTDSCPMWDEAKPVEQLLKD